MISHSQALGSPRLRHDVEEKDSTYGLLIALLIINLWTVSLTLLLSSNLVGTASVFIPAFVLFQMFLYTGLFITAHDAMHGAVFPHSPKLNNFIGALALLLFGLFDYRELLKKHWLHHRHPATSLDPDFHDGEHKNFLHWYRHFMTNYWSWKRIVGLAIIFTVAAFILHISVANLLLFWALPSILSSIQLFYFGTFLTHREPKDGYRNCHRSQTNSLPTFWSFLTCYHFGYHEEHHSYPHVPWWRLPEVYQRSQETK